MKEGFTKNNKPKISVRFKISLLLMIITILAVSTVVTMNAVLSVNRNVSKQKAEQLFDESGYSIKLKLDNQLEKAVQLAGLMATLPEFSSEPEFSGIAHPGIPFIIEALSRNTYLYSMYTGFKSGNFLQVIKTSDDTEIIRVLDAPENTAFCLRSINSASGKRAETWTYLDEKLDVTGVYENSTPSYTPGGRPWFESAVKERGSIIMTAPYVYDSLKQSGITAASAINTECVAGVDITLVDLKLFIDSIYISENAGILLLDENGRVISANLEMEKWLGEPETELGTLEKMSQAKRAFLTSGNVTGAEKRELKNLEKNNLLWSTPLNVPGGQVYTLIITAPASDFLQHQKIIQNRIIIVSIIIFILVLPIVLIASRNLSRFLEHLADDAERVQHLIFSGEIDEHSPIIEFEELAEAFRVMKKAIAAKTRALETALKKLERIIELGISMSVEEDPERLVEMILKGAKELSNADGGSLYLKEGDGKLNFKIVLNDSLGFAQGGTSRNPISMPPVQLYQKNGEPNYHNVVSCAVNKAKTIVIDDAYSDPEFDFSGTRQFDKLNVYRSTSFLTVPLKLQGSEIIGALQLINCCDETTGEVIPFNKDIQSFIEALSGLAAAVLYNRELLNTRDALFESLIQLTASAIDTKSPYTGGHCERVPVLAQMLATKAEEVKEGPLADFKFENATERKAYQIGSWLHDAGKMTTPEFVIDKAVKLETIHNRIHEIRTRFEVILRDAQLEAKEEILNGGPPEIALKKLEKAEAALHEDFNFIARCNTGEEIYSPEYEQRILEISSKTWLSHFDHTAGLSREERGKIDVPFRRGETIQEHLLADKPVHIIPDLSKTRTEYLEHNFNLPKPDYLYNRGEIHNLLIKTGTLTEEERFKINEHIMQTIVMLEKLPFPEGMSRIPEFGGTHHETLTGSGYPRGVKAEKLSTPSRIMAIADIFEALTASDRPYKDAKTLSEAVEILYQNTLNGHIDSDLFKLFISSGVYLEYAEKFLLPEQIDEVDVDIYLNNKQE